MSTSTSPYFGVICTRGLEGGEVACMTSVCFPRQVNLSKNGSTFKEKNLLLVELILSSKIFGGGRVARRCWVNFQCRGVLLIWIIVGQGPIALAVGAGGGCLDIFSLIYHFSFLSPSLWETARYRLQYCLKGPLSPKQPTNQPTNLRF